MIKSRLFEYIRISPHPKKKNKEGELERNCTEENQKISINKYLDSHKEIEIVDTFIDLDVSGSDNNRKHFREMLDRIDEVDGVIVFAQDRLTRDEQMTTEVMYSFREKNKILIETKTGQTFTFSEMPERLLTFVKGLISSEERLNMLARQKIGFERWRKEHPDRKHWGIEKKWGTSLDKKKKYTQSQFIKDYTNYKNLGMSKLQIARNIGLDIRTLYKRLKELKLFPEEKEEGDK